MDRLAIQAQQEAEFYRAQEALRAERLARIKEPLLDATGNLLVATVTMGTMEASRPSSSWQETNTEDLGVRAEHESRATLTSLGNVATMQTIERNYGQAPFNPEYYATGYASQN